MISNEKIIANAVSGKTARPCDCCIRIRARWYCAADDAFLCQGCDGLVHSANPLARRHERVRLKMASLQRVDTHNPVSLPSWSRGSTRKARTPRHAKHNILGQFPPPMVPELGSEETTSPSHDGEIETEDWLLYRVPILDPFVSEMSASTTPDPVKEAEVIGSSQEESYQPSDLDDLEEFAADVETLLGKGLDESYGIDELGFFDNKNNNDEEMNNSGRVAEEDELGNAGQMIKAESEDVAMREPFDLSFVYDDFPSTCELEEDQKMGGMEDEEVCKLEGDDEKENVEVNGERKKITLLRLDYAAITEAWATQGSPWMSGQRPDMNLDERWPHCLLGTEMNQQIYGEYPMGGMLLRGQGAMGDGGREARVSRYREKRRTRLFSKKIRYQVRKLNAEKRPRMKGRFVKRSSFPPTPLLSK